MGIPGNVVLGQSIERWSDAPCRVPLQRHQLVDLTVPETGETTTYIADQQRVSVRRNGRMMLSNLTLEDY